MNMNTEISSLQEMSFNVIIEHFARFNYAYSTTTEYGSKKNVLFLQRVYTPAIFARLLQIDELDKDHLKFLLNEYLKEIDVGIVLNTGLSKEETIEKIKSIGHSLEELSLNQRSINLQQDSIDSLKALVPFAQNVTKMLIPYVCDDELLKLIATNCSHLLELNISGSTNVTGAGLQELSKAKTKCPLKIIRLSDMCIKFNDIGILLESLSTLQEVDYDKLPNALYSLHKQDVDNNALEKVKKYNLISLNFSLPADSSMLISYLSLCSKLCPFVRKIVVSIAKSEELDFCCEFLDLEDVVLESNRPRSIIDVNKFLCVRGCKLKKLTINSCNLSMSTLITKCSNLESLVLKNTEYQKPSETVSNALPYLKNLQLDVIDFSNSYCVESVALLLNSSPNLENLSLFHCEFMESEIIAKLSLFSLNCSLTHLNFLYSDVGIDLLQQIVLNCNSLKKLSLDNCENINAEDIEMLQNTITASNKKIEVVFDDDQSELSYSDYDYDFDPDYDVYDAYDYCYDEDYGGYDDEDDYPNDYESPDIW